MNTPTQYESNERRMIEHELEDMALELEFVRSAILSQSSTRHLVDLVDSHWIFQAHEWVGNMEGMVWNEDSLGKEKLIVRHDCERKVIEVIVFRINDLQMSGTIVLTISGVYEFIWTADEYHTMIEHLKHVERPIRLTIDGEARATEIDWAAMLKSTCLDGPKHVDLMHWFAGMLPCFNTEEQNEHRSNGHRTTDQNRAEAFIKLAHLMARQAALDFVRDGGILSNGESE